jgi:biopolymer transport protein ExbD
VLLVVSMLHAGNSTHRTAYADLAFAQNAVGQPKAIRDDAMRVMVLRDGSIFFRNAKVDLAELPTLVRRAVKEGTERRVYLAVDARTKYGDAKVLYDAIAADVVRDIWLMAEKIVPR